MATAEREVVEVLRGAAALLERDGWLGRAGKNPRGPEPCCIWQAVVKVASKRYQAESDAVAALISYLKLGQISELWDWNDEFGRTREDVVAALLETAALLEALP